MDLDTISIGPNPPMEVNVIIEISCGSSPIKYEFDKKSGSLCVDRFISTSMYYPANYGFIPHTLSQDGDPVDVLVITPAPIQPGAIICARPIGVLIMKDEAGQDEKILMVPIKKLTPYYDEVTSYKDLPSITLKQISHFFQRYKDLEPNKWVEVTGWEGPEAAAKLINEGRKNIQQKNLSLMEL